MKKNFLFIIIFTIAGQIVFGQSKEEWKSKVDPVVINKIQSGPTEFMIVMKEQADLSQSNMLDTKEEKGNYVYKTLVETAKHSQASVISLLDELKLDYKQYWIANAYLVKGDLNAISQLANLPAVAQIIENASYTVPKPIVESFDEGNNNRAVEWGLTQINADKVWALGYKGQGAVVGGEDTGYDWTHPAIKKKYRGWNGTTADHNYNWHDAITTGNGGICGLNSKVPCDDQQHGTHTMGTMIGDDGAGNQIGVAPMAKWIGARNMGQGAGTLATYVDCFQ
ncbi:MAG: S8 family serine peptidase, partial [Bacteroidetes bacterium]|nr:S8 family serine peptidase [Bacteroidota bacterium]